MTFSFIGAGGGGSGVSVWQYLTTDFDNTTPSSSKFIEIWDPNDPLLPEPASAHVLVYGPRAWMKVAKTTPVPSDLDEYPPACGSAFGYKRYTKGEIPTKVYGWRGFHMNPFPYPYDDHSRYFGFDTKPAIDVNTSLMLPNCGGQQQFHQTDFLPSDAVTHQIGDWTKVFNGGKGHYWVRPFFPFRPDNDGAGSNASFFGPGYDGGHFPGGSGGPGTDTSRGPAATHIADGVLDELGLLKVFVKGKPASDNNHADNGDYEVVLPPDLFLFGQLPFQYDTSLLKLPVGNLPCDRRTYLPGPSMIFAVILEFKQ